MKFIYYETEHKISQDMGKLVEMGFEAEVRKCPSDNKLLIHEKDEVPIVYGILRGTGPIIVDCSARGTPFIYIDRSYFHKCREEYYRFVVGGRQWKDYEHVPSDRFKVLGIDIKPVAKGIGEETKKKVIIVPMSVHVAKFEGIDPTVWLEANIHAVQFYGFEPVVMEKGLSQKIEELFPEAACVITHESTLAISAILNGVPSICSAESAAAPLSGTSLSALENMKYSYYIDEMRIGWHFDKLAYQQFSIDEIADGTAKRILGELERWEDD